MKRIMVIILSLVLALSLAGTVSAASKATPLNLVVDGKAVQLKSSIVMINGKNFVEFRTLLETLGYEVGYEQATKLIRAKADGITAEMSVAGDVAFVNGKTVESKGELINQNNKTLIGLRFAGVISGYKVDWDGKTQTITLTNLGPTAAQKAALLDVFNKMLEIEASGEVKALDDIFSDDTVLNVDVLKESWLKVKTKTTIHEQIIESYSDTVATVIVKDETVKLSGSFSPNNKMQTRYTLHKSAEDQPWKIYNMEPLAVEFTNIEELFEQAVTLPAEEKTAIEELLEKQVVASIEEDIEGMLATLKDFEGKDAYKEQLQQLFATTTSKVNVEKTAIVEYSSTENKASLLIALKTEVDVNNTVVVVRTVTLNKVEKIDGKWLFQPESLLMLNEQQ